MELTTLTLCWITAVLSSAVSVEPVSLRGYSNVTLTGSDVTIRCRTVDNSEDVTRITWQRRTGASHSLDTFMAVTVAGAKYVSEDNWREDRNRVTYIGEFHKGTADLMIRGAGAKESGTYTCVFTLFPSGNHSVDIAVSVWTKPKVSAWSIIAPAVVGCSEEPEEQVKIAECTVRGANVKPTVIWDWTAVGEYDNRTSRFAILTTDRTHRASLDGKVEHTAESVLLGNPLANWNGVNVMCVVSSPDGGVVYSETAEVRLNVMYSPEAPEVTRNRETGELECHADANPPAKVSWERPDDITWDCVATNNQGTSRARVYRVEVTPVYVTVMMYGALCLAVGATACLVRTWCRDRRRNPLAINPIGLNVNVCH